MKILHYNIYEEGRVGMSNILMSIENALLIAKLTDRDKIVFYCPKNIFNSKDKKIFDLYDIDFEYEISLTSIDESIVSLEHGLHNLCIYTDEYPTKNFLNGRTNVLNINDYTKYQEFRTKNNETLGFYSYLFYFSDNNKRKVLQDWLKNTLKPKQRYLDYAKDIVNQIRSVYGTYSSIHVRRGDYLFTSNRNKDIQCQDLDLSNLNNNNLLIIHSDESSDYFSCLKDKYKNIWYIDNTLSGDTVEKGLVSLLVASYSDDFIGTMFSTFTSYIQRYRMYNGLTEDFKFLYSQKEDVLLYNNRFKESSFGENTWNRITINDSLRQICFWFREWQESYYQKSLKQQVRLVPDFVDEETTKYIISKLSTNEFFERENRNRTVLDTENDLVIKNLVVKACEELGYNPNQVEYGLQVFKQYKGGETFLHTDSVFEDERGKRIASILFYLNDEFEGSYIDFPYIGVKVKPKKGTMITYPLLNEWNEQDLRWSHSASVITKGYKIMSYFSIKQKEK